MSAARMSAARAVAGVERTVRMVAATAHLSQVALPSRLSGCSAGFIAIPPFVVSAQRAPYLDAIDAAVNTMAIQGKRRRKCDPVRCRRISHFGHVYGALRRLLARPA